MPQSLQSLLDFVRGSLISDASIHRTFLSVIRHEGLLEGGSLTKGSADSFEASSGSPSKEESHLLQRFWSEFLPTLTIKSTFYLDTPSATSAVVEIASSLARSAADDAHDAQSSLAAQFCVIVSIIHQIAHIFQEDFWRHSGDSQSDQPHHIMDAQSMGIHRDAGPEIEMGVLGGTVGVVLRDEALGELPPFRNLDFRRIDYFFLLSRDQKSYRLDISAIERWFRDNKLAPFDVGALKALDRTPDLPELRSCARLNSTFPPLPPPIIMRDSSPPESHIQEPTYNWCGTHDADRSDSDSDDPPRRYVIHPSES